MSLATIRERLKMGWEPGQSVERVPLVTPAELELLLDESEIVGKFLEAWDADASETGLKLIRELRRRHAAVEAAP